MTKMPKTYYYVHCHICPIKDKCDFATPDESYKYQKAEPWDNLGPDHKKILEKLDIATNNCPILKTCKYFGFI